MVKDKVKPLGRWNIEYCNTKINQKIDLSNEDHCGPCGQYAITKISQSILDKIDIVQKVKIVESIKK
jgi:hypothetical protein